MRQTSFAGHQVVAGARTRVNPDVLQKRGLSDAVYTIGEIVGTKDNAFVRLTAPEGS